MSVTRVQCYKTEDGRLFDTRDAANEHTLECAVRHIIGEDLGESTHEEVVALLVSEAACFYSALCDHFGPSNERKEP